MTIVWLVAQMDVSETVVVAVAGMVEAFCRILHLLGPVPPEWRVICYEAFPKPSSIILLLCMDRLKLLLDYVGGHFRRALVPVHLLRSEEPVGSLVGRDAVITTGELLLLEGGTVRKDGGKEETEDPGDRNAPEFPCSGTPEDGKDGELSDEIAADCGKGIVFAVK